MTEDFDGRIRCHYQLVNPGVKWVQDPWISIDSSTTGGGINLLTPNVVHIPGGYRMYYTQLDQVRDYTRSTGNIRSARSDDAQHWTLEPGIRLDVFPPHAANRVLCPDVIPLPDGSWRMYFEAASFDRPSVILSARSSDGLSWTPEPGTRFASDNESYGAPRCLYLMPRPVDSIRKPAFRLYCQRYSFPFRAGLDAHNEIISAVSFDGLTFEREPGVRVPQQGELESYANSGPEVIRLGDGTYRMYYGGWQTEPSRARIFSATSSDGVNWERHPSPCIDVWGTIVKSSEPCVIDLPDGRHRLFYEACDAAGQWRILSATSC